MIIQCPACNTSFSVSTEKFGTKNRKVKCSKCYFIWTANSQGKAIEVPPLYESINSQGGVIKENKNEKLDPNIKPDHPLPVPVKENDNEKGSFYNNSVKPLNSKEILDQNIEVDVCVVGGGLTGISSALNLSKKGYSVVLCEARKVGWGASGRNGGQLGIGMRKDQIYLEKKQIINRSLLKKSSLEI